MQIIDCIMAQWSHSLVCTLHYLIIMIMEMYLKVLNFKNARFVFDLINICRQTPLKFHTYMDVCRVHLCPSNDILDINKSILVLMLGLHCKERKLYSNKIYIT